MSVLVLALTGLLLLFSTPSLGRPYTNDEQLSVFTKIQADNKVVITNCSTSDDDTRMQLVSYSISPDTAKRGETVNFEVTLNLREEITSGTIDIQAQLDGKTLLNQKYDLCDTIKQANLKCPLPVGVLKVKLNPVKIPDLTPAGTYSAHATVSDQNDKELGCFEAKVKMPL